MLSRWLLLLGLALSHHPLIAADAKPNIISIKRDELLEALLVWQQATHAPIPTQPNPTYAPGTTLNGKRKARSSEDL